MMPWYEDFFDEDYMRFHLRGGATHAKRAPAECDFVARALELKPGDRILDLCCGQGRHAVELAKRGFQVTGADLSEHLLSLAKKAAQEAGVDVRFHRCDMRELPWDAEFDAVINMWTSFGYLESDEEDEKVLRAVHRALRPGGRFHTELPNREVFLRVIPDGQRTWYEHEGHFVLDEHTWDAERKRLRLNRLIIEPGGARRHTGHDLREYTHPEIVEMLTRAGFEWQRTFADLEMSAFQPESKGMFIIAGKP
jgi:ubiquinone/menaquinone biosynthesis C-methylase UbiE